MKESKLLERYLSDRRKSQMGPVQIAKKTDGTGNNSNKDRWDRE